MLRDRGEYTPTLHYCIGAMSTTTPDTHKHTHERNKEKDTGSIKNVKKKRKKYCYRQV